MEYLDTFASSESYFLSSDGTVSEWYIGWYTSWYVCGTGFHVAFKLLPQQQRPMLRWVVVFPVGLSTSCHNSSSVRSSIGTVLTVFSQEQTDYAC